MLEFKKIKALEKEKGMTYFFICLGANILGFVGVLFVPPGWLGWFSSAASPVLFILNVELLIQAFRPTGE
ncbi:MAG: hypothetical protein A3H64_00880 [Candidatus Ryanbacteria bacterium RIFCSPLOWO2_02_FULL_45_11c]|uniref:2TM domain-containing protein n=1 Tax=Candidatus Ryanbacteria bacterium RIFCSPLOWO2_02_FULL_45_11c TaxID=1802128 RepID=A0A1G2H2B6_9BACT|nr:MAG: hypothetical protein A3H64_00880 [Candidatus Ryanbacteria bacterium RIFCSPLOWO2_02_FULL_45_11c]